MIKLPPFHQSVIIGLVLSDAGLYFRNPTHKNAHLEFEQSLAHYEYVWFVFFYFSSLFF